MDSKKYLAFIACFTILLLANCDSPSSKSNNPLSENQGIDSTNALQKSRNDSFILNFDRRYSGGIQFNTASVTEIEKYSRAIYPDTQLCTSFVNPTLYMGILEKIKVAVKEEGFTFLQSGKLNLVACNLPVDTNKKDTLIVTAKVYDIHPDVKTMGFPAMITALWEKK